MFRNSTNTAALFEKHSSVLVPAGFFLAGLMFFYSAFVFCFYFPEIIRDWSQRRACITSELHPMYEPWIYSNDSENIFYTELFSINKDKFEYSLSSLKFNTSFADGFVYFSKEAVITQEVNQSTIHSLQIQELLNTYFGGSENWTLKYCDVHWDLASEEMFQVREYKGFEFQEGICSEFGIAPIENWQIPCFIPSVPDQIQIFLPSPFSVVLTLEESGRYFGEKDNVLFKYIATEHSIQNAAKLDLYDSMVTESLWDLISYEVHVEPNTGRIFWSTLTAEYHGSPEFKLTKTSELSQATRNYLLFRMVGMAQCSCFGAIVCGMIALGLFYTGIIWFTGPCDFKFRGFRLHRKVKPTDHDNGYTQMANLKLRKLLGTTNMR